MTVSFLENMYSKNYTISIFDTITNTYFKFILPLSFLLLIGGALVSERVGIYLLPAIMVGSLMIFALLIFGIVVSLLIQ